MFYALRHKDKKGLFIGIFTTGVGDEAEFQNNVQASFEPECFVPFITNRVGYLERVLSGEHDVPWYNSSPEDPELSSYYKTRKGKAILSEYEVVKLDIV